MIEGFIVQAPDKFALVDRSSTLAAHKNAGLFFIPMGIENGTPIQNLEDLRTITLVGSAIYYPDIWSG